MREFGQLDFNDVEWLFQNKMWTYSNYRIDDLGKRRHINALYGKRYNDIHKIYPSIVGIWSRIQNQNMAAPNQ
jgi:hypothetical protein